MWILRAIAGLVIGVSAARAAPSPRSATTVYVGRHFEVREDDHVIRIVDKTKTGARGESAIGGMLTDLKASIFKRAGPGPSPDETGAHEFGHTAGLEHHDQPSNLMMEGGRRPYGARNISLEQIQAIWQASRADKLNQRDKVMGELDDIAKRR